MYNLNDFQYDVNQELEAIEKRYRFLKRSQHRISQLQQDILSLADLKNGIVSFCDSPGCINTALKDYDHCEPCERREYRARYAN